MTRANDTLPETKMKAISFFAPHWELVFKRILTVGDFMTKTRNNDRYHYRGPVLCFTSQKAHFGPVEAHGMKNADIPRGVVGIANIADVRELTDEEKDALLRGYNNFTDESQFEDAMCGLGPSSLIYPMDFGYMIDKAVKFKKPFVPPIQHMFGPVGAIPLYPEIEEQLPKWAID